jgi:outer membrane protein TolC
MGTVPVLAALAVSVALLAGCAFTPKGTKEEQARLAAFSPRYEPPIDERALPELPPDPGWRDVLQRAFLANGDLEAAYFEWKAALDRVGIASAWPNSNIAVGFSYAFSADSMKTFDRMTFAAGFDAMENLSFPVKTAQAGKVALAEARAAGDRFRRAKFALQERVLAAWADYALLAERERLERAGVELLAAQMAAAGARVRSGAPQHEILRVEIALRGAEDGLRTTESELSAMQAMLNGMLARGPLDPLPPPRAVPAPRPVPADDALILAAAADANPDLAVLARQVEGRADALELARLQWIPDINPTAVFTGSVSQAIGAIVVLPTTIAEIRGAIHEAGAMLRASQAMLRQAQHERGASVVATLVALRNGERQADLFAQRILPAAEQLEDNLRLSYATGSSSYAELIEAQRALLDVRLTTAEARTAREKRLAELEALAGVDIETVPVAAGEVGP